MLLSSFLDPVGIQKPRDIDLKWGKYSLITLIPLSNSVISYLSNFTLFEGIISYLPQLNKFQISVLSSPIFFVLGSTLPTLTDILSPIFK